MCAPRVAQLRCATQYPPWLNIQRGAAAELLHQYSSDILGQRSCPNMSRCSEAASQQPAHAHRFMRGASPRAQNCARGTLDVGRAVKKGRMRERMRPYMSRGVILGAASGVS